LAVALCIATFAFRFQKERLLATRFSGFYCFQGVALCSLGWRSFFDRRIPTTLLTKGQEDMIYVGFTAIVMSVLCTMGILFGKIDLGK